MNVDLSRFEADLGKFAGKDVTGALVRLQKKVAFDVFGGVIQRTPVDEGRAKGSWTMQIGEPNTSVQPDGQESYMHPEAGSLEGADGVQMVWINNQLPYIVALEDGHSDQAPAGMVDPTIAQVAGEFS